MDHVWDDDGMAMRVWYDIDPVWTVLNDSLLLILHRAVGQTDADIWLTKPHAMIPNKNSLQIWIEDVYFRKSGKRDDDR